MAYLELRNVSKKFGDLYALEGMNLSVRAKEFVVLVGPSGCGKSTTLMLIAGLESLTGGEIHIDGERVDDVEPKDRDIAMVFQNYALYPHMNVYDNMAFGLKLRRVPKAEIRTRVHKAASILEIEDLLKRKPRELSGGQRQRVAMGRAIVRQPKVFLFDEPLSNLDAKLRVQMRAEISTLHAKLQSTIIYVTHDQVEAMTLAGRIVVMKDGRIMDVGTPLEVYNNPSNMFVAGFIGSPAMNFFPGHVERDESGLFFANPDMKLRIPDRFRARYEGACGREIVLGMRPQSIHDALLADPAPGMERVETRVQLVEPLGNEVILLLSTGRERFRAVVDPRTCACGNKAMEVLFDMNKMYLFHGETEEVIR